jgi:16S rRNA (uracil1498-N3)-methyltransferase
LTWKQALAHIAAHDLILVPWEDAQGLTLKAIHGQSPQCRDIGIVIGAEGGMSESEINALREAGAQIVTLGPRILRAETAAIASVAMVMTLWGDL